MTYDDHLSERGRVLALIRRYGWNATSFQTLEAGFSYYFEGDDACVAYVDTGSAWIVAGAPIAPCHAVRTVALSFQQAARAQGKRCCFFATEARFVAALKDSFHVLRIGEQPVWNPQDWPYVIATHKSLREQVRRARAKGVVIRQLSAAELENRSMRQAIVGVVERWLCKHSMSPMGFLVSVDPFTFADERRCFVAEINGVLVGFAGVIPVPARSGWFIEDLIRDPDAPNGTAEMLVDAVMRWAGDHGARWLTLGLSPLSGDVNQALRFARKSMRFLYNFGGLGAFRRKLNPNEHLPIYLCYPKTQSAWISMIEVLRAFAQERLVRFGIRSILTRLSHR